VLPSGDVNVWITGLAGLRGMAWWSGDCAGLCRLEWCSPMEQRLCSAYGSLAWQALGGTWQSRDHVRLCRPEGLGWQSGDPAVPVDHWLGRPLGCHLVEIMQA
jgi:hypothetical protein